MIKEHKYGCSVITPKCPNCGKYFNALGHRMFPYATGGYFFQELYFYCIPCKNKLIVPQIQLDILNKYSTVSKEWFNNRILWPPLPKGFVATPRSDTFYSK